MPKTVTIEAPEEVPASFADTQRRAAAQMLGRQVASIALQSTAAFGRDGDIVGGSALVAAEQAQAMIVALEEARAKLLEVLYERIDDAFVDAGVSLAEAAREIGLPKDRLRAQHLEWRRANPDRARQVQYRERDPEVFLQALKAWRKTFGRKKAPAWPPVTLSVPHPKGEAFGDLALGYWVRNQRTTVHAGKGDPAIQRRIDEILGEAWREKGDRPGGRGVAR